LDHWFDDLCKQSVGDGKVSRRNALRGVLASLAAAGSRAFQSSNAFVQTGSKSAPPKPLPPGGGCVRWLAGSSTVAQLSVAREGMTFDRQLSHDRAHQVGKSTITISRGQTLIVKIDISSARGATTASVHYGADIKGVKNATLNSPDGKTFQGSMDGRAFTTSASPRSMSAVRFADGRPHPQISANPKLASVVTGLTTQAKKAFATCHTTPHAPRPAHPHLFGREVGGNGSPGSGWYEPGETYSSPDCTQCWNNCGDTALQYSGLTDWETWLCPACIVAAFIAYDAIWVACWGTCQLPGGGCCPVPCGGAFVCCGRNDNCFRGDLCCPGNMVVCRNVCCGPGVTSCAPDGFCGCPSGQAVCGDNCCASGTPCCGKNCCPAGTGKCCGDSCCPAGTSKCCGNDCCPSASDNCCGNHCCPANAPCINNVCCASPSHVCPGSNTCCPPLAPCCGSACCSGPDDICLSNRNGPIGCCPRSRACGVGGDNAFCCPPGQQCVDTQEGICAPCPTGRVPCAPNNSGSFGSAICCAPNVECCMNKCCKPGEVCCRPLDGRPFGCWDSGACVH
jgi:hypothetical protein